MSNRKIYEDRLKRVISGIQLTANKLGVHPSEITKAQLFKHVDNITSWELREVGGISGVKKSHFPVVSKDLITIREQKQTGKYINELEKKLGERGLFEERALKAIDSAISKLKVKKISVPKVSKDKKKRNMTMELMLSDIHYGKKTELFDLEICRERLRKLTSVFLKEIEDNKKLYNVERLIIALLGDLLESYTMHGMESSIGCEFGNSQQVDEAIESLFYDVIVPIAKTGISIDIPCVTGNHDRVEKNRTYNNPGLNNLTWIIYNGLERLSKAASLSNVKFYIPKGPSQILDIYGNNCLYEHGDNVKANTKSGFESLMEKRARQEEKVLHFGRFGHWHESSCFDRGRIIVNESVCGQDSYAMIKGFKTSAGQTINYYIETKTRPTCFYKSFPVYLG